MWMRQHKNLAMALGIGFASLLLIFVAMIPIFNNANMLAKKIKTKTSELNVMSNKVSLLSKLDPGVLKERVDILDSALPPRKDVLLYLSSIEGLSRELGLTFGGISLEPGDVTEASSSAKKDKKMANGLQSLETDIKMSGNQDSVYSFLRTIEGVLPLMQIKDIKVTTIGDDQYSLALVLSMLWAEPAAVDMKGSVQLFGAEEEKYFLQLAEYRRFDQVIAPSGALSGSGNMFQPFSLEKVTTPQQ